MKKLFALLLAPWIAFAQSSGNGNTGTSKYPAYNLTGKYNLSLPTYTNGQNVYLSTDVNGRAIVAQGTSPWVVSGTSTVTASKNQTYSATSIFTVAASPTDVFTITGSGTKTVKILYLKYIATKTANGFADVYLIRRSSANTGGTSTTLTAGRHDTNNAAATAVVRSYTANPSALGTTVANLFSHRYFYSGLSVVGESLVYNFDNGSMQPITLLGTSEVLAVNLNSTTISGNSISISVTWSEE